MGERKEMGWEKGIAMRHTCNRRVEDAEEVGPPRGGGAGWRGVGPLPHAPWRRAPGAPQCVNDPDHGLAKSPLTSGTGSPSLGATPRRPVPSGYKISSRCRREALEPFQQARGQAVTGEGHTGEPAARNGQRYRPSTRSASRAHRNPTMLVTSLVISCQLVVS